MSTISEFSFFENIIVLYLRVQNTLYHNTQPNKLGAHLKSISRTDLCALGSSKIMDRLGHSKILKCPSYG